MLRSLVSEKCVSYNIPVNQGHWHWEAGTDVKALFAADRTVTRCAGRALSPQLLPRRAVERRSS